MQLCGSSDCVSRKALLESAPPTRTPPTILIANGAIPAVTQPTTALDMTVVVPCDLPPPISFRVCDANRERQCGVVIEDDVDDVSFLADAVVVESRATCSDTAIVSGECAVCAFPVISSGGCPVGNYQLQYSVWNSAGLASVPLNLRVRPTSASVFKIKYMFFWIL